MTPSNLPDLIAGVESNHNQYVARFEPLCVVTPVDIAKYSAIAGVSQETAKQHLATSWGLFQIMGYNLLHFGLNISFVHYCCAVDVQQSYFQKYLQNAGLAQYAAMPLDQFMGDAQNVIDFARKYNGPGDVGAYVDRMTNVYRGA